MEEVPIERAETLRLFEAHRKAEAARDYDAVLATFTADCFFENGAGRPAKRWQRRHPRRVRGLLYRLPDVSRDDQGRAIGDDVVVVWGTLRGTNDGDWLGVPPGGGSFAVPFVNVVPFKGGLMAGETISLTSPASATGRGATSTRFGRLSRPGGGERLGTGDRLSSAAGKAGRLCARVTRTLRTGGLRPVQASGFA
jgi:hypothetical protein